MVKGKFDRAKSIEIHIVENSNIHRARESKRRWTEKERKREKDNERETIERR